jgi:hypothetical protein
MTLFVGSLGESNHNAVVPGKDGGRKGKQGAEGVADDVMEP